MLGVANARSSLQLLTVTTSRCQGDSGSRLSFSFSRPRYYPFLSSPLLSSPLHSSQSRRAKSSFAAVHAHRDVIKASGRPSESQLPPKFVGTPADAPRGWPLPLLLLQLQRLLLGRAALLRARLMQTLPAMTANWRQ